jgi:N-acetylglucosaminyldiphosphoundecaprenol N-acetyl-beta-D-mannosaminyltransferase
MKIVPLCQHAARERLNVTKTVDVLGISFINTDMDGLVQMLDGRLSRGEKTFVVTANPEIVMHALKDPDYFSVLKQADVVTPDGIGIVIGAKLLGTPIQERLTGYDLMWRLFQLSAEKGYKVYFLGAAPDVIEEAARRAVEAVPGLRLVGYHHGYFDVDDRCVIEEIKEREPDILLVGLGFPKQEKWIERFGPELKKGLMIGVGGSFDVLAGKVKRAPLLWRKLYLEWLYRLIQQPSRWRRMLALPRFLVTIFKIRFRAK